MKQKMYRMLPSGKNIKPYTLKPNKKNLSCERRGLKIKKKDEKE